MNKEGKKGRGGGRPISIQKRVREIKRQRKKL